MTVYRNEGKYDSSNVEFANGQILRYDKKSKTPEMRYIDYGLGVFDKSAFAGLPEDEPSDLAGVYRRLLERNDLAASEVEDRFYEIGSLEGIRDLEQLPFRIGKCIMSFSQEFLVEVQKIVSALDTGATERMAATSG